MFYRNFSKECCANLFRIFCGETIFGFFDSAGHVGMLYVTGRNEIRDPIIFIQSDKIYEHYNQQVWTTYDVLN